MRQPELALLHALQARRQLGPLAAPFASHCSPLAVTRPLPTRPSRRIQTAEHAAARSGPVFITGVDAEATTTHYQWSTSTDASASGLP